MFYLLEEVAASGVIVTIWQKGKICQLQAWLAQGLLGLQTRGM